MDKITRSKAGIISKEVNNLKKYQKRELHPPSEPQSEFDFKNQPFGNNFFLLFWALRDEERNGKTQESLNNYLKKARSLEKMQVFIDQQAELLSQIDVLVSDLAILDDIRGLGGERYNVLGDRWYKLVEPFHPRVCEHIGLAIWEELNPLLKKAAEEMAKLGIDPSIFYG
jgi:hypothetical protein